MIVPLSWDMINSTDLEIKVKAFDEERQALKKFEWKIKSFGTKEMIISINFAYPERISDDIEGKDILEVRIINPTNFFSEDSLNTIKNETFSEIELPK